MAPRVSQRDVFIKAAANLFHSQGFRATGVEQVIGAAGGSKGSFYHHFKSKNDLGRAVLDSSAEMVVGSFERVLCDHATPPVDRLLRMLDVVAAVQEQADFRKGCVLGNLTAELGGTHEDVRQHVATIFARWSRAIARTLQEARERGELPEDRDPDSLAHFILFSLEGAILFGKAERTGRALADCRRYLSLLLGRTPATMMEEAHPGPAG